MPHCEQSSIKVGIIGWKKSGRVTLLNNCEFHRHLRKIFTKQKLFLLKSVNKIKIRQFLTREVCFFSFPDFTDFGRAVTFLLVKIILNFKNCAKALSKLFLTSLINFFIKWSLQAQNAVWTRVPHPIFAATLCSNREYLEGGESVREQLSQQFTCPYKE
jgi:hypothetical protein